MSKKHLSTEEVVESEHEYEHDRLGGESKPESSIPSESPQPPPEFYPIGNPQDPGREVKPEPWDTQEFYDKVRAAGFPTSSYGDAAFMQACYNLAESTQPPSGKK
jgi:hypothetical protein